MQQQIHDLFIEKQLDLSLFEHKEINIIDIILKKKKITQRVTSERKQIRLQKEDTFNANKKYIGANTLFKHEEYSIGEHIIYGIEPGTIQTENCFSCDGHGETTCNKCLGTGEQTCSNCNGEKQIKQQKIQQDKIQTTCSLCSGNGQISKSCIVCKGKGQTIFFDTCNGCKGKGKIQGGYNNKTKKPIFQFCSICNGKKRIQKQKVCLSCQSTGLQKVLCTLCKGQKTITQYGKHKETYFTTCTFCNKTGKTVCKSCRGNQSLLCGACGGERRTLQYQLNKFEITIKNDFKTINQKFSQEEIDILSLDNGKELTFLYDGEKEKLKSISLKYNIKINKINIRRIEGTLYSFKLKKKNIENNINLYYHFFVNKQGNVFYNSLPNISQLNEYFSILLNKMEKYYKKGTRQINKILNKLSNKKTY